MFSSDDPDKRRKEAETRQQQRQVEQTALNAGVEKESREGSEEANFLSELRRVGIDSDNFHFLSNQLGPELADSHAIGNRSGDYEQVVKWRSLGKSMQHVSERDHSRHCQDNRDIALAEGTTDRPDRTAQTDYTTEERRAVRSAYEAVANYQSLSVENRGGQMVSETTVTAKRQTADDEKTTKEKAGGLLD